MTNFFPEILDDIKWEIGYRVDLEAATSGIELDRRFTPIPSITYNIPTDTRLLIAAIGCATAKQTWIVGGWYQLALPLDPSFTGQFVAPVRVGERTRLYLAKYKLIQLPDLKVEQMFILDIPPWFRDARVEIYYYYGNEVNEELEILNRLDANWGS